MQSNKNSSSKFDKVINYLETTGKIVKVASVLVFVGVLVFAAIKLMPLFKQNKTNINVDNELYTSAMNSWSNGDYVKAEEQFLAAIEQISKQYGEDDIITAQVRQKLGALYIEMTRYKDAIEQLIPAYVTFRKRLGESDGMTITTRVQISISDIHLGNYEQGFRDLNEAYDNCTSIGYKVQIAQGIAQCHLEMGEYVQANQWYDVLETLYEELYANSNSAANTLAVFWNDRALLYSDLGQSSYAINAFEKAQEYWMNGHNVTELSEATLSAYGDQALANILINEALTMVESNGNTDAAFDYVDKALIICQERFGEHNSETARCYTSISGVYNALQDKENEKACLDKALDISLNTVGKNSELSASIYDAIGRYYSYWGDYKTAIPYFETAIDIRRNILDYYDFLTAYMYENIANAKNRLLDFEGAIEAARTAVEICESLAGENNTRTAEAYIELSRPLINTNQYDDAQELLNKSIGICQTYFPEGSTTEAFTYQYQMKMYLRQKKYEDALTVAQVSLELFKKVQGENHSNTADAKMFLADTYVFLGDASKADPLYAEAVAVYNAVFSPEIVHNTMDGRVRDLIALESINTENMTYQEIEDKVSVLSEIVTDEQVENRYSSWGFSF